jgi:RNA polymerase sigma factor (sigma-70 family)
MKLSNQSISSPSPQEIVSTLKALSRRGWIHRLAWSLRVEVEDATNEAFIRAVERISTFAPTKGKMTTWLLAILRNTLYQLARDARRGHVRSLVDRNGQASETIDRRQEEPCDLLLDREQQERAGALLRDAGPFVGEVARLREQGLTFRAVAERMKVPKTLVVSRWFSWCRAARKKLKEEE